MKAVSDVRKRYLSFHDAVTGLYNRAFLEEEMQRMDNERFLPLSFIMGEVGGTGEELLRRTATALKVSSRQTDIIARWGRTVFVLLLPNTGSETADRIRRRIENLQPSIALGVSSKVNAEQNLYRVLGEADERMREMKKLKLRFQE